MLLELNGPKLKSPISKTGSVVFTLVQNLRGNLLFHIPVPNLTFAESELHLQRRSLQLGSQLATSECKKHLLVLKKKYLLYNIRIYRNNRYLAQSTVVSVRGLLENKRQSVESIGYFERIKLSVYPLKKRRHWEAGTPGLLHWSILSLKFKPKELERQAAHRLSMLLNLS